MSPFPDGCRGKRAFCCLRRRPPLQTRPAALGGDGGEARVKRIERPSVDQMLLISDNPDYMPELRQGSAIQAIKIIGKVVCTMIFSWTDTSR